MAHKQFMSLEIKIPEYLPSLSIITEPAKTEDMISISSRSLCGEDDFRGLRLMKSIRLR